MKQFWGENWFPILFTLMIGGSMLLIGFVNGWA